MRLVDKSFLVQHIERMWMRLVDKYFFDSLQNSYRSWPVSQAVVFFSSMYPQVLVPSFATTHKFLEQSYC